MNSNPIPFNFESHTIRAIDRDGEIWFIAADVCSALGHEHQSSTLRRLDEDEKGVHSMHTLGGAQEVTIISEPGLYRLTLTSRKAAAKRFTRWVTHKVLPEIRNTGSYSPETKQPAPSQPEPLERAILMNLNALSVHLTYLNKYWSEQIALSVQALNTSVHNAYNSHILHANQLNSHLRETLKEHDWRPEATSNTIGGNLKGLRGVV